MPGQDVVSDAANELTGSPEYRVTAEGDGAIGRESGVGDFYGTGPVERADAGAAAQA